MFLELLITDEDINYNFKHYLFSVIFSSLQTKNYVISSH